jgi:hypothetical protein
LYIFPRLGIFFQENLATLVWKQKKRTKLKCSSQFIEAVPMHEVNALLNDCHQKES